MSPLRLAVVLFPTCLQLGLQAKATEVLPCIPLTGITPGGGDGVLDEDLLRVTLEKEPWDLSNPLVGIVATCAGELETPVSMRNLLGIDTTAYSVSSVFHPTQTALDIFGDKTTSDARRRCQPQGGDADEQLVFDLHLRVAIAYSLVYGGIYGMPFCRVEVEDLMEELGMPLTFIDGETTTDTPWGLAKAYVEEINTFLTENDGWNADGSMNRDYNRVPFSDYAITDSAGNQWQPYTPLNTPYEFIHTENWQPLTESDGLGYITTQEHVTPHIGVTGRLFGFNSTADADAYASRQLEPPSYTTSYRQEVEQVLEETRLAATDAYKLAAISFYDNKFASLIPLKIVHFTEPGSKLTSQDFYQATVRVQLAIYNGVVLSWREKVRHDAPRPSTIARYTLGDEMVETYAGPDDGVQNIKASEWEAIIRTMPHSEYPSASSCLCEVFAEQVKYFLGSDTVEPPIELGAFQYSSWSAISEECGNSRLWGGMHFAGAVPAGATLCGGGEMATSISATFDRLLAGDETAAVFKKDVGDLIIRPL